MLKSNYNLIHAKLIIVVSLFAFLGGCISIGEEGCTGRIQINEKLYNQIELIVGDTTRTDLLGAEPVFTHPSNIQIVVVEADIEDEELADVTIIRPNGERGLIELVGLAAGNTMLTVKAEDSCAGSQNPKTKEIEIQIKDREKE